MAVGKSRLLRDGLWGRAFVTAYDSANDGERLRMAEGLGKQGRRQGRAKPEARPCPARRADLNSTPGYARARRAYWLIDAR